MSFDGGNGNGGDGRYGVQMRPREGGGQTAVNGNRDAWNQPIKKADDTTAKFDPATGKPLNNAAPNGGVDDQMVDDIWKDITKAPDLNKPQEIIIKQEPVVKTGAEQLKDYLVQNGLGEFTLSEAEKAELQGGNFDSITAKMHELAVNAHTKALSGAQTIIKSEVDKLRDELKKDNRAVLEGDKALAALHSAVPATKHPAIGPIAQTIYQRLTDRGASQEQAIEGVKKWFALTGKEMGFNTEVNGNRNGSFRGGQSEGSDKTANWLDILSGKN